jgi:hypothetical protein
MSEITSNPIQFTRVAVKCDFVVNEFPKIKVPSLPKKDPDKFTEMSKIQRQLILKRLIERIDEI